MTPGESARLEVLRSLHLLDTPRDPAFERIATIAKRLAGADLALISLVDDKRQWFKACAGELGATETPRDIAFCAHVVADGVLIWVEDARLDARFSDNPAVTGEPYVRFYAGAPVIVDGQAIGTLCLVGFEPRAQDEFIAASLIDLAGVAAEQCRLHRALADGERAAADAKRAGSEFQALFEGAADAIVVFDEGGHVLSFNPAAERAYGYPASEVVGGSVELLMREEDRRAHAAYLRRKGVTGLIHWLGEQVEGCGRRSNGEIFPLEVSLTGRTQDGRGVFTALIRDVTERKWAEQALWRSEARFSDLFRGATEGFVVIDVRRDDLFIYEAINPAMEAATGLKAPGLVGRTAPEVFGERGEALEAKYRQCAETGRPIEWIETYELSVGSRTFHTVIAPMRDEAGRVARLLVSGRDVTAWEAARRALRDSERRQREILEALPAAIYTTDAQGRITYFNKASVEFSGRTPVLGEDSWCVSWRLHNTDGTPLAHEDCPMAVALKTGEAVRGAEAVAERPDGRRITFTPFPTPLHDEAGRLTGAVNMLVDVTEQRAAEAELRFAQAKFERLFDDSGDALFVVARGKDGVIRYERVNREGEMLLGVSNEYVVGRSPMDLLPPELAAPIVRGYEACLDQGSPLDFEDTFDWAGESRTFHALLAPIPDSQGLLTRVLASSREVTERKTLEARLRASQKLEALGQLAGGVAHDFNNLLLIIDGYTRMAQKAWACEEHEEVLKAAERGAALVKQLLVFSRRQVREVEPAPVADTLLDLEPLMGPLLGERCSLRMEISPDVRALYVDTDTSEFGQAMLNLVTNARDAMPEGGEIVVGARMLRTGDPVLQSRPELDQAVYAEIRVQDRGVGMPDEILDRIFDPFFTTKGPGAGTGMGLAMVHGYAEQSGGAVTAESRLGLGSTFRLLLPLSNREPLVKPSDVASSCGGSGQTVLLVEDDPQLLKLNRRMLEELGYRVLSASNGMEALEVEAGHDGPIPLVVTDVVMPVLSGFELADMLKQFRPEARVVFMSGYPTRGPNQAVSVPKGALFLAKPFSPSQLAEMLSRAAKRASPAAPRVAA